MWQSSIHPVLKRFVHVAGWFADVAFYLKTQKSKGDYALTQLFEQPRKLRKRKTLMIKNPSTHSPFLPNSLLKIAYRCLPCRTH